MFSFNRKQKDTDLILKQPLKNTSCNCSVIASFNVPCYPIITNKLTNKQTELTNKQK